MADKLKIDPEFESLCPPLAPEEVNYLEDLLSKDGCLEPIAVWAQGNNTILDGHNRYRICTQLGIKFKTTPIEVTDRNDAKFWIIKKQLGRRNLAEEQKSYLRAQRYAVETSQGRACDQNGHKFTGPGATRKRLAAEYGVGEGTIQRDVAFAKAVDALPQQDRAAVLSGTSGLSMTEVREGKRPSEASNDLRAAKRKQRARERIANKSEAATAIAEHGFDDVKPTPEQKRLVQLCRELQEIAAGVSGVLADEKSIASAKKREHWTAHNRTRLRAQLAGIKRELSRIEKFF